MIENKEKFQNCIERTFTSYLENVKLHNLHPDKTESYKLLPEKLEEVPHLILYGPSGIGKK